MSGDGWLDLVAESDDGIMVLINNGSPMRIISGPGPAYGNSPLVRLFPIVQGALPVAQFQAYGSPHYGVRVGCGDFDGDGADEILTGAGPGAVFGPHVRGWNYDGSAVTPLPGLSFFAWDTGSGRYGVNVSSGVDLNDDGRDELVAGRGPDPAADTGVKVFTWDGSMVSEWISLTAYPEMAQGVYVAAGEF